MSTYSRQQKEKKIVEAAIKLFGEKGMHHTKMDEVAKLAKISKGLTYFYFKSKEELYLAITKKAFEELKEVFQHTFQSGRDETGFENMNALVKNFLAFAEEKQVLHQAMVEFLGMVAAYNHPEKRKVMPEELIKSSYFRRLLNLQYDIPSIGVSIISKGIRDGSIRPELQPETTFYLIWTMLLGYEHLKGSINYEPKGLKIHEEVWNNAFMKFLFELLKGSQNAHKFQPVQGKLF